MTAAAAGNYGVFDAAKAKGAFAYGVGVNQCPSAPGTVVDNVVKRTDIAVENGVEQVLAGQTGTTTSYDLKEGGISQVLQAIVIVFLAARLRFPRLSRRREKPLEKPVPQGELV